MNTQEQAVSEFAIKDCAIVAIATGRRAANLRELRDILEDIHQGSIYQHFWGALLHPRFVDREFNNDFASWARHALRDNHLAERLAVIDPTDYEDLEALRRELIDVIEERLDEREHVPWAKNDQQFSFMRFQVVVFDTHHRIQHPKRLPAVVRSMSPSSIFYHFIDARRRPPQGLDDFRAWLVGFKPQYDDLCRELANVDPFFQSLPELRSRLAALFTGYFGDKSS